jgi:hypothetical protein
MILLRQKIFMLNTYVRGADGKLVKSGSVANGGGYSLTGNGSIIQGSGDQAKNRKAPTTPSQVGSGQLSSGPIKAPVGIGKSGVNVNTVSRTLSRANKNNTNIITNQTNRENQRNMIKNTPGMATAAGIMGRAKTTWNKFTNSGFGNTVGNVATGVKNTWNKLGTGGKAAVIGGSLLVANSIHRRKEEERRARERRYY